MFIFIFIFIFIYLFLYIFWLEIIIIVTIDPGRRLKEKAKVQLKGFSPCADRACDGPF